MRVLIAACAVPAILLAACGVESRECEEPEKIEGIVRGQVTIGATCGNVLVQSTLVAAPGSIVTIEPGSTLRFATGAGLEVRNARLVAEGTALKPIVFQGRSKKPGAWQGILFDNGPNVGDSVLRHVTIEHTGHPATALPSYTAGLIVSGQTQGAKLHITNTRIQSGSGYGLILASDMVGEFSKNVITENELGPVLTSVRLTPPLASDSDYAGNGRDVIKLTNAFGSDYSKLTLRALDVPYESDSIDVWGEFTLEPGTTLMFVLGAQLRIESGPLIALGTAERPITISGSPNHRSSWGHISTASGSRGVRLDHVRLIGGWDDRPTLRIDDTQSTVTNSHLSHPFDAALSARGDAELATFSNNTFTNEHEVRVEGQPPLVARLEWPSIARLDRSNTFAPVEGAVHVPRIVQGAGMATIPNLGNPIQVGDIEVWGSGILSVEPGTQLGFDPGTGISVSNSGTLLAVGTESEPIVLRRHASFSTWTGVALSESRSANKLEHVVVYNGHRPLMDPSSPKASLRVRGSVVSIANSRFHLDSGVHGVGIQSASGTSVITGCARAIFEGGAAPSILGGGCLD